MLNWTLTFLVLALVAALLGFGGVAAISVDIARFLFGVFILLFLISIIVPRVRGPVA